MDTHQRLCASHKAHECPASRTGFAPWQPRPVSTFPFRGRVPRIPLPRGAVPAQLARAGLCTVPGGSRRLLGPGGRGPSLGEALGQGPRRLPRPLLQLVCRRRPQHLPQRARLPRRARARPAGRTDLRQPRHWNPPEADLRGAERRGRPLRRRAPADRGREGRPGDPLPADGARSGRRDARLRPARGRPLRRLRRFRAEGARDLDWGGFLTGAEPAGCVPVAATDPLFILYTRERPASRRASCATAAGTRSP